MKKEDKIWGMVNKAVYGAVIVVLVFAFLIAINQQVEEEIPLGAPGIKKIRGEVSLVGTQEEIEKVGTVKGEKVKTKAIQVWLGAIMPNEASWKESINNPLEASEIGFFSSLDLPDRDRYYRIFIIPDDKNDLKKLETWMTKNNFPHKAPENYALKFVVENKKEEPAKPFEKGTVKVLSEKTKWVRFYDVYEEKEHSNFVKKERNFAWRLRVLQVEITYPDGVKEIITAKSDIGERKNEEHEFPLLEITTEMPKKEEPSPEEKKSPLREPILDRIVGTSENVANKLVDYLREEPKEIKPILLDYSVIQYKAPVSIEAARRDFEITKGNANYYLSDERTKTPRGFSYVDWYNEVTKQGIKINMPSPEYLYFIANLKEGEVVE